MIDARTVATIPATFQARRPFLDERRRRGWAAARGRGGGTAVAVATGRGRPTIGVGIGDRHGRAAGATGVAASPARDQRVRRRGGGRRRRSPRDRTVLRHLAALLEPVTRGDPLAPRRWRWKSTRPVAADLGRPGRRLRHQPVAALLHALADRRHRKRTTTAGAAHPDRAAPFASITAPTGAVQARGQPVSSVDTTPKELVGDGKHGGRAWRPTGQPAAVPVPDVVDRRVGKAIPAGGYEVAATPGWVRVGTAHDTAAVAGATSRRWWEQLGRVASPHATAVLIIADGGDSHGRRRRRWTTDRQGLADATGLRITVCPVPPGTSTGQTIAHRLLCPITQNGRRRPLVSPEGIVELIGRTTTQTGLTLRAGRATATDPTGVTVSAVERAALPIQPAAFHAEGNDTLTPRPFGIDHASL